MSYILMCNSHGGNWIVGTYFKDKLEIRGRPSVDNLTKNEISITAEEKSSKK